MIRGKVRVSIGASVIASALLLGPCDVCSFNALVMTGRRGGRFFNTAPAITTTARFSYSSPPLVDVEVESSAITGVPLDSEAIRLKDELATLASATRRGFSASRSDRDKAKQIITALAKYSPTAEPAAAYYKDQSAPAAPPTSLAGKWTLLYTDAPDITGLEGGPFSTAKLGRIGQECIPPTIKNVIEWTRPEWASSLPFSGEDSSRILQKVCCEGASAKERPAVVDLTLVGVEVEGENDGGGTSGAEASEEGSGASPFLFNGPAAFFESNPVKLQGPLTAPFGKFEILYLDEELRITKTSTGYYAVNIREETTWF